jgi:hypothetical protein
MTSSNPYEPPPIPEEEPAPARVVPPGDEYDLPPFRSPKLLASVTIVLLSLLILHSAAGMYVDLKVYWLMNESILESELDNDAISVWQSWASALTIPDILLSIIAHFCLIAWAYRCHRNLESLGHRELDSKHIWVIICWFVPVLNFYCPFLVMREIWWRSFPDAKNSLEEAPASHMVFWWWLLKVTSVVAMYFANASSSYQTWPQYYLFLRTSLLSWFCEIASAILTILIVHRISGWQIAHYRRLQESAAVT